MQSALTGLLVNILLAAVKILAGVFGHSYALVADGIESMSDVISSCVVFFGLKIASLPPDENHPYGHGKAEPFAALLVSVALGLAAIIISVQSIREIYRPHHAPAPFTLVILVVVIITKELMFRWVFQTAQIIESGAVKTDAWHHRSDAITSAAAFIGISIALIGGPRYAAADDWAALAAAVILVYNAYHLFRPALAELVDTAPDPAVETDIRNIAAQVPGVILLEKCFIRKMGFDYYVDLHVEVDGNLTVRRGHEIAHDVKDAIRAYNPRITDVLVHIEPTRNHRESP